MTKEQYIKMNRGINDSKDLPEAYLSAIYDQIKGEEIKLKNKSKVSEKDGGKQNPQRASGQAPSVYRLIALIKSHFPGERNEFDHDREAAEDSVSLGDGAHVGHFQGVDGELLSRRRQLHLRYAPRTRPTDVQGRLFQFAAGMPKHPLRRCRTFSSSIRLGARRADPNLGSLYTNVNNLLTLHLLPTSTRDQLCWTPFLAAFSVGLQDCDDSEIANLCLDGIRCAIRIACIFHMELERDAFVQV